MNKLKQQEEDRAQTALENEVVEKSPQLLLIFLYRKYW